MFLDARVIFPRRISYWNANPQQIIRVVQAIILEYHLLERLSLKSIVFDSVFLSFSATHDHPDYIHALNDSHERSFEITFNLRFANSQRKITITDNF